MQAMEIAEYNELKKLIPPMMHTVSRRLPVTKPLLAGKYRIPDIHAVLIPFTRASCQTFYIVSLTSPPIFPGSPTSPFSCKVTRACQLTPLSSLNKSLLILETVLSWIFSHLKNHFE